MALVACPECGRKVSTRASACPNCGLDINSLRPCSDCEALLLPDAASCPECGCPTGEICPECSAVLPTGTDPCTECGCPVGDAMVESQVKKVTSSRKTETTPASADSPELPHEDFVVERQTIRLHQVQPNRFGMGYAPCFPGNCDDEDAVDEFYEAQLEIATNAGRDCCSGARTVQLTTSYWLGIVPVTQALWTAVMGSNPSEFEGRPDSDRRPVDYINWYDAVTFCNKLSKRLGLPQAYTLTNKQRIEYGPSVNGPSDVYEVEWNRSSPGFRLPTEAEWECAAKAGADHLFAGSNKIDDVAWVEGNNDGETQPVGRKKPNAWGFHDMSGNVGEWVADYWVESDPHPDGLELVDPDCWVVDFERLHNLRGMTRGGPHNVGWDHLGLHSAALVDCRCESWPPGHQGQPDRPIGLRIARSGQTRKG